MNDDKDIFKKIRELPPEMNIEEVKGLITGLTAAPLPQNHWFPNITLRNILMITLPTTVVFSTLLMLFPVKEQEKIAVVENPTPIIKELVVDTPPQNQSIQSVTRPIKKVEKPKRSSIVGKFKIDTLRDIKRMHPILKIPRAVLVLDIEPLVDHTAQKKDSVANLNVQIGKNCELFQGNISRFSMYLKTYLLEDGLYKLKDGKLRISFFNSKIVINRRLIPEKLQEKYAIFFAKNQIIPCPVFIIEITKKYIAAGKITLNGFKGRVEGSITLNDLNKIKIEDIQPIGTIRKKRNVEDFHSLVLRGDTEVHIKDGELPSVWLELANIEEEAVITSVDQSVLTIDAMSLGHGQNATVRVFIEAPIYRSIIVEDMAKVVSKRAIMAEDLSIIVRHQAEAKLEIDAEEVTIDVISGDLVVFGRAGQQIITGRPPLHQGSFDNSRLKVKAQ
ncbi:MAG: DUF2807 domain-containing protein [Saprospiraceae bacterium]|nr:DUF2807 domain-containing protein [Saprospiraceae bacterium]